MIKIVFIEKQYFEVYVHKSYCFRNYLNNEIVLLPAFPWQSNIISTCCRFRFDSHGEWSTLKLYCTPKFKYFTWTLFICDFAEKFLTESKNTKQNASVFEYSEIFEKKVNINKRKLSLFSCIERFISDDNFLILTFFNAWWNIPWNYPTSIFVSHKWRDILKIISSESNYS